MYNTGNPVPSAALEDMADNAQVFDNFVNSSSTTTPNRNGASVKTRAGFEVDHNAQITTHEAEHDAQMQAFESDFDGRLAGMAFTRVGTFATGATLTDMRQVLVWEASQGGDGHEYGWSGAFPKVVAAASTPATSGGIGAGTWVDRTDVVLRAMLASSDGTSLIHHKGENTPDAPLNKYLAWGNGDISAFGGKYDDSASAAANKIALQAMENLFGGININLMGKSLYLPDSSLADAIEASNLNIWGGGTLYTGHSYNFKLKEGGSFYGRDFTVTKRDNTVVRPILVTVADVTKKYGAVNVSNFRTEGRQEVFTVSGDGLIDPTGDTFGINSVNLTHFHAESPYDFMLFMSDFPVKNVDVSNFTIHNMAGTFVQISTRNTTTFERQLQKANRNVSIHDYSIINDDSFWADAANVYVSLGVIECWNLSHYNGFQTGIKCRVMGNVLYDMYNGARLVHEHNITVTDCFAWNDHVMRPHKIKGAYQYSSQNKRWYYRRNYVTAIKALFPEASEASSKGTFFWPETQDWHTVPIGALEYGNRFIHIDNCDIELIKLGAVNTSPVNNNIRLTNNHFSSSDSGSAGFAYVAVFPYDTYQQIAITGNRFDLPSSSVTGLVRMYNGVSAGGGGFTGTVDISRNTGRFGSLLAFTDYNSGNTSGYANMALSIADNQFVASGNCRLTAPGQTTNQFDMSMCSGNYLKGSSINLGQLWNTQGAIEIGARAVSASPIVVFTTGVPSAMNVAVGDRYINIDNGSSGVRVVKFSISKSGSATTITCMDVTSTEVTKTTGVNNGTFNMNVGSTAGFTLQCIVSSTEIIIQTGSSVSQRFIISGYSV